MIGCRFLGHRPWSGWRALSARLRAHSAAASTIAAIIGGALMLVPAGTAWPNLYFADALVSAAILDWVKGALSLIFMLRRRLGNTKEG